MPDKWTVESKRPYKPRTRTGCVTCRRIKCDEARPSCQKCSSTGRKCDGYTASETPSPSRPRELSLNVYKTAEESSAIDFLLRVSIPQFAGNSSSEFWDCHVLQLAQQDVATRHALIALSQLHRDFTNTQRQGQHNQLALQHYDAAIRSHINSVSGKIKDRINSSSAMTTAIVFICIEIMQGHLASAVSLLQHSVAMLPSSGSQQVPLYEDIISRLQIHARRSIDQDMFGSNPSEHETKEGSSKYKALGDWRASCQALLKDCAAIFGELTLEERIQRLCIMLGVSKVAHTTQPIPRETAAHNVLHMRRLLETTDILTEEAANLSEDKKAAITDSFLPLYRAIVSLAQTNLGLSDSDALQVSPLAPSFSLDMGVIGPLYEVSRHCRDPTLRRKIVHLLRMSNRQEGLLNSITYAKIVETIIDIEETGLRGVKESRDIPLQSRISQHCLSFDVRRLKHTISYKPLVGNAKGFFHREISR
ncbi:hypothetical protein M436DRAFT_52980 [Aureobasidium namibiae CBS 147.97]|uniref:Zn(2)-C6 fungal-type domain-containing protein n=1 Tax=Aureobasidium namibiae CBS 147.97 TaxID=1043004 RepID=A0A074X7W0_9PEZI|nr:uncharacterized protein M436DRAFT_52980 [Aureobasidium namibiae CBS 147.97]KEQ70696.1 hypothetical protein M436DRAFT_52980 [Aureobasidium namibiae CBS 147.97]